MWQTAVERNVLYADNRMSPHVSPKFDNQADEPKVSGPAFFHDIILH